MYFIKVGGNHRYSALRTVERFDPDTRKWRRVASMSTRRQEVGLGVLNGLLYAVNCEEQ